uniref:RING-CH-type domain-containing protein n=1 Tax=Fagus sylvatica TaxID=28930 RepID=A0A2N9J769_FAGSY
MGDHLVLCVDRLITPESLQSLQEAEAALGSSGESSGSHPVDPPTCSIDVEGVGEHLSDEEEPLIQTVECRICQEEDSIKNLEIPCACNGSLKIVVLGHGFITPKCEGWTISGTPLDLRDPRLLAMAAAERHLLEAEYDDYADTNASGAAFCRSAALILMALLLLRHALSLTTADGDDDASTFFSLFLLRAAGFLLPCYIMAWAISILQRRRQRQEAAALAATEVAFMLQAGQHRALQFTIAPGPPMTIAPGSSSTPHQEPLH